MSQALEWWKSNNVSTKAALSMLLLVLVVFVTQSDLLKNLWRSFKGSWWGSSSIELVEAAGLSIGSATLVKELWMSEELATCISATLSEAELSNFILECKQKITHDMFQWMTAEAILELKRERENMLPDCKRNPKKCDPRSIIEDIKKAIQQLKALAQRNAAKRKSHYK